MVITNIEMTTQYIQDKTSHIHVHTHTLNSKKYFFNLTDVGWTQTKTIMQGGLEWKSFCSFNELKTHSKSLWLILTDRSSLPLVMILLRCVGHRSRYNVIFDSGQLLCPE